MRDIIEWTHKGLDGVHRLLNFIVMVLSVNVHDRVSDLLDLLSMLGDCLEVMLVINAMSVNWTRKILERLNILFNLCISMSPPHIIDRSCQCLQLVDILNNLFELILTIDSIHRSNKLLNSLSCLHNLLVMVISVDVHHGIVQTLE